MKKKISAGRLVFNLFNYTFFIFICFICVVPVWHVFCASFSDPAWVMANTGIIWRIHKFNLEGYKLVFANSDIWSGYLNTIIYVAVTTVLGMFLTVMMAYAGAKKDALFANAIMFLASFTMLFNGGMIASYIVNTDILKLYDTRLAIILPVCVNAFYLILIRTAIQTVPDSLIESAKLDGANDFVILFRIILALIKATLATVIMYYIIMQWNSWFSASIYLRSRDRFPLQLILKELLINASNTMEGAQSSSAASILNKQLLKYCTIIVSTAPILFVYPFVSKYFQSGVMIGAVKG